MSEKSDQKSSEIEKDQVQSVSTKENKMKKEETDETSVNLDEKSIASCSSEVPESEGAASLSSKSLMAASSLSEFKKIRTTIEDLVAERSKKDGKCSKSLIWATRNLTIGAAPCSDVSDSEKTESVCSDTSESDDLQAKASNVASGYDNPQFLKITSEDLSELVESLTSELNSGLNLLADTATQNVADSRGLKSVAGGHPQSTIDAADPLKLLTADPQLFKAQLEKEIEHQILEPLCTPHIIDKNNPEVLSDIKKFSTKRRNYLRKLVEECKKVKAVMMDMNTKRHENSACRHQFSVCQKTPLCWSDLLESWDETFKSIDGLMKDTQKYIKLCHKKAKLPVSAFDDYVNVIVAVFEDVSELFNLCEFALEKFRCVCFLFDDYHFLLYINCFNIHLLPLLQKITEEFKVFTQFDEELQAKSKSTSQTSKDDNSSV